MTNNIKHATDRTLKAEWVAALRSGEYRQGKNSLRCKSIENGQYEYCCLGVLCDLAVKHGEGEWRDSLHNSNRSIYTPHALPDEWSMNYPSRDLSDRLNLGASADGALSRQSLLGDMNDDQNKDFLTIADWIEANL
jgi:hypothetical protein